MTLLAQSRTLSTIAFLSCLFVPYCSLDLGFTNPMFAYTISKARSCNNAGGILQDASLLNQSPTSIRSVAAPKIDGAHHLIRLAGLLPTINSDFFSSTSALLGPLGQANYASANAQLNALASCHQSMGKAFTSTRRQIKN